MVKINAIELGGSNRYVANIYSDKNKCDFMRRVTVRFLLQQSLNRPKLEQCIDKRSDRRSGGEDQK